MGIEVEFIDDGGVSADGELAEDGVDLAGDFLRQGRGEDLFFDHVHLALDLVGLVETSFFGFAGHHFVLDQFVGEPPVLVGGLAALWAPQRDLGDVTFLPTGRRIRGDMVRTVEVSMEPGFDEVEVALLDQEVPSYLAALARQPSIFVVSAVHNHELLIDPPVKYVHAVSGADPATFARAVGAALRSARNPITGRSLAETLN